MPQTAEPVDDAAALVHHRALHLVLVRVRAPVTRLQPKHKPVSRRFATLSFVCVFVWGRFIHLDEGYLAGADVALEVADGDLAVMLQVALLTEDVVDAGHDLVPLIVVPVPARKHPNSSKVSK